MGGIPEDCEHVITHDFSVICDLRVKDFLLFLTLALYSQIKNQRTSARMKKDNNPADRANGVLPPAAVCVSRLS